MLPFTARRPTLAFPQLLRHRRGANYKAAASSLSQRHHTKPDVVDTASSPPSIHGLTSRKSYSALRNLHSSARYGEAGGNDGYRWSGAFTAASSVVIALGASLFWTYLEDRKAACKAGKRLPYEPGSIVKGLPTFTAEEVKKKDNPQSGIWVIYKNGVYDVTKFVGMHPGGDKILLAAGGSLEPYFELYGVHKSGDVMEIVESMRIGNILDAKPVKVQDAYKADPDRSAALVVNSAKPFNAEPPQSLLLEEFITPNSLFFVRNHMPVPVVTDDMIRSYKLEPRVDKEGPKSSSLKGLTLDQIKSLPSKTMTVTLQCAGNRRKEMSLVKEVKGLSWNIGSISTAEFTGARLIDVIHAMGYTEADLKHKYIQFEGLDIDPSGVPYGSSIATEKAMDPNHCVMVAYSMNGEDIPADHGYPLRVIIPGVVGARNVKWLKSIVLSNEESKSHWQRRDYKCFNPSVDMHSCDFDLSTSVTETPVQSAICEPRPDTTINVDDHEITVKGYAYSGGGRGIIRVDLSLDGGKTWINPELDTNNQSPYKSWAWTLWEASVPIPKDHKGKLEIVCKAIDSSHNVQPENVNGIWNHRGLLNNSWHRISVNVQ